MKDLDVRLLRVSSLVRFMVCINHTDVLGRYPNAEKKHERMYTPGSSDIAGWNGWTRMESMYFPIQNRDMEPASYMIVEGTNFQAQTPAKS